MSPEKTNKKLTFAFCTYNRAERLENLVTAMRSQTCPVPYEILAINNNSSDDTSKILTKLSQLPGTPLRWVTEPIQGIVAARNRAINEALNSDVLVFIDDDETPQSNILEAAAQAIFDEGAQCAGGKVYVDFSQYCRPTWLEDELLGFLAAVDYGNTAFWIEDPSTPIWTANIAYDMRLFRDNPTLRFDKRYDRKGKAIGGGEDVAMFKSLLSQKARIRYIPDMAVIHAVEPWRLNRCYFLKLHFLAGKKSALHQLPSYKRNYLGIPPFLISQSFKQFFKWLKLIASSKRSNIRQLMNVTYLLGQIYGCFLRWKEKTELNEP